jgi:hypothetical protein
MYVVLAVQEFRHIFDVVIREDVAREFGRTLVVGLALQRCERHTVIQRKIRRTHDVLVMGRVLEECVGFDAEVPSVNSRVEFPHEASRIAILVSGSLILLGRYLTLSSCL